MILIFKKNIFTVMVFLFILVSCKVDKIDRKALVLDNSIQAEGVVGDNLINKMLCTPGVVKSKDCSTEIDGATNARRLQGCSSDGMSITTGECEAISCLATYRISGHICVPAQSKVMNTVIVEAEDFKLNSYWQKCSEDTNCEDKRLSTSSLGAHLITREDKLPSSANEGSITHLVSIDPGVYKVYAKSSRFGVSRGYHVLVDGVQLGGTAGVGSVSTKYLGEIIVEFKDHQVELAIQDADIDNYWAYPDAIVLSNVENLNIDSIFEKSLPTSEETTPIDIEIPRGGEDPNSNGKLLYFQGFESDDWKQEFTGENSWGDHVKPVTSNAFDGQYSLRGNLIDEVMDPITNLPGLSYPVLDWRGPGFDISSKTPNGMYFSYYLRHDDYNHLLNDDGSGEGKLLWIVDEKEITKGMFINNMLTGSNLLRLVYNNGASYGDDWAREHWGYSSLYLSHPEVEGGTDGRWRRFEIYYNYQEKYIQIWVDGKIMKSNKHGKSDFPKLTSDGKSYYESSLNLKATGIQFFWTRNSNINSSTNASETRGGWQIDNLEVWDGMP